MYKLSPTGMQSLKHKRYYYHNASCNLNQVLSISRSIVVALPSSLYKLEEQKRTNSSSFLLKQRTILQKLQPEEPY
jgi:hypothetical protein